MSDPQSAIDPLIYGIPLALWVAVGIAVLSAVVTLISVCLSNANSRRNLREQLERDAEQFSARLAHDSKQLERRLAHEADQRDRERQMSLRREVYLEAAAALTHANALIGRITDIQNDVKTLAEQFTNDLSTIAKVHVVGSDRTVQAVMAYVSILAPSFIELTAERVQLTTRKVAIDLQDTFLDAALAERKRFTAMMQQLNLDGVTDASKWEPINCQNTIATEAYESHSATKAALWKAQVENVYAIIRHAMEIADQLTQLLLPAILAVRSEMELPLDAESYTRLIGEQLVNMKIVMRKVLESLKQQSGELALPISL